MIRRGKCPSFTASTKRAQACATRARSRRSGDPGQHVYLIGQRTLVRVADNLIRTHRVSSEPSRDPVHSGKHGSSATTRLSPYVPAIATAARRRSRETSKPILNGARAAATSDELPETRLSSWVCPAASSSTSRRRLDVRRHGWRRRGRRPRRSGTPARGAPGRRGSAVIRISGSTHIAAGTSTGSSSRPSASARLALYSTNATLGSLDAALAKPEATTPSGCRD